MTHRSLLRDPCAMSIIDPAEYGSGGVGEISSHILSNVGLACRLTISARAMEPVRACGEDRHIGTVHASSNSPERYRNRRQCRRSLGSCYTSTASSGIFSKGSWKMLRHLIACTTLRVEHSFATSLYTSPEGSSPSPMRRVYAALFGIWHCRPRPCSGPSRVDGPGPHLALQDLDAGRIHADQLSSSSRMQVKLCRRCWLEL